MKVALCIAGDFDKAANIIAGIGQHVFADQDIDVFSAIWTYPQDIDGPRDWIDRQLTPHMNARGIAISPVKQFSDWDKFGPYDPATGNYVQHVQRFYKALQLSCQMKAGQERTGAFVYDAVVCALAGASLRAAPPITRFMALMSDHVILGCQQSMGWWPSYDYRLAIMSSKNFHVYAAISTLHRRQYLMRFRAIKIEDALPYHLQYSRLTALSVPVVFDEPATNP